MKYQHAGVRRSGRTGDGVTLIDPGWAPEPSLTVTALPSSVEGVWVLRVVGEVDLATVGRLREQLHHYIPGEHRGVVLDCTGVSFLAACGIGLLVETAERACAEGMTLRLVVRSRLVQRALEVTLADLLISGASTVAEAVAQCAA
ncbi:MAG: STAS domain-containing protein [Actinomycetota bacterium]|nr:STAS domain-containing protein [Actinomycetota bacterium]